MSNIYLDMTRGISGDMFVSASYAYMDEQRRELFRNGIEHISGEFELGASINELKVDGLKGINLNWNTKDEAKTRSSQEAAILVQDLCEKLGLSKESKEFGSNVIKDILLAESDAHKIEIERVHLHEIGRLSGLANIASAALCLDILELHDNELIGSYISIGEGSIKSEHGILSIPAPASAFLLKGMKFRFGPNMGEMATPAGIAIVKNAIKSQSDVLPSADKEGIGFGSRIFENRRGYVRIFSAANDASRGD